MQFSNSFVLFWFQYLVFQASVQTVPKEVKNKSTLCTPLSHNKGVSCTTQTVEKGVQTGAVVYMILPFNLDVHLSALVSFWEVLWLWWTITSYIIVLHGNGDASKLHTFKADIIGVSAALIFFNNLSCSEELCPLPENPLSTKPSANSEFLR